MLNIDLRSIILLAALMAALMAAVTFLLSRSLPASIRGLERWAGGVALLFLASLLFASRGVLPDFWSALLANVLFLLGLLLMFTGLHQLLGSTLAVQPWALGLALLVPVLAWFIHVQPHYGVLRSLMGMAAIALFVAMGLVLRQPARSMLSARLILAVLLVHCAVLAFYLIYHWLAPAGGELFDAVPMQSLYLLSYACTILLATIGVVLVASELLRSEQERLLAEQRRTGSELRRHRDRLQELVAEQTRDLRLAKDAAEAASRAKSEFLASMSHELRTPLNAVLGHAQLLQLEETLPGPVHEQVDEIAHAGQHLLTLVNDLIDLARIEAGRLDLDIQAVALETLLPECLGLVRPLAEARDVALTWQPPDGGGVARVRADAGRLRQVVLNLLSNAIKYNRVGGQVLLHCEARAGWVRVLVVDTGEGIAPDKQQRLFTAFDRLGRECGQVEGTGIGLVISKRMVEAMGGRMGFESEVGQGSVFWLELPGL